MASEMTTAEMVSGLKRLVEICTREDEAVLLGAASRLAALDKVARAAVTFCESSADYPALVQSIGDMRAALKEAGYGA